MSVIICLSHTDCDISVTVCWVPAGVRVWDHGEQQVGRDTLQNEEQCVIQNRTRCMRSLTVTAVAIGRGSRPG
jgi:hypothetical protein